MRLISLLLTAVSRRRSAQSAALAFALFFWCQLGADAATPSLPVNEPISGFSIEQGAEFYHICRDHGMACGVEEVQCGDIGSSGRRPMPVKINLRSTSIRKVLDKLIRLHVGYRWAIRSGVLNIEPTSLQSDDPLERRIMKLSLHDVSSFAAFKTILNRAGINFRLEPPEGPGIITSGPLYRSFATVNIELDGVSVRDALNAVAKSDGQIVWMYCPQNVGKFNARFRVSTWRSSGRRWNQ